MVPNDHPRQCVFVATINPGGTGYLGDETGNRRYWIVKCGVGWQPGRQVDTTAFAAVRDQLWAEAFHRFNIRPDSGENWWLEGELKSDAKAVAAQRLGLDAWHHDITTYLYGVVTQHKAGKIDGVNLPGKAEGVAFVTCDDIFTHVLHILKAQKNKAQANRIGKVLRTLGWLSVTAWVKRRGTVHVFYAPDDFVVPVDFVVPSVMTDTQADELLLGKEPAPAAAGAPADSNVTDLADWKAQMRQANMTDEEIEKLAAAF